jgi:twitching motility protein PilT
METTENITFQKLLKLAAEYKASDLHFTAGLPPVLRIDDKLKTLEDQPLLTASFIKKMVYSFLDEKEKEILEKEKEIVIAHTFKKGLRFRANIFYQKNFLSASFRFIPEMIKGPKELGLPSSLENFTQLAKGLVIITGPFGSGKSTTLISLVNEINKKQAKRIVTLERPIEHLLVSSQGIVEQREVGRDTASFIDGLEFMDQEDIDVVMVSEIESKEVIKRLLKVAEAGRLIFSMMNVDSVVKCLEELINFFPPEEQPLAKIMLADNLKGIVSQRLIPKIEGGRVLALEILINTPAVQTTIREGRFQQIKNILQTSQGEGMVSLDVSLARLVKEGLISPKIALKEAADPESLKITIAR